METPYASPAAPEADIAGTSRSMKFYGRAVLISGLGIAIPPLIGLVGTVTGMMGAFAELRKTGSADPSALAGDISVALLTTIWGLVFSLLALIPFVVFLVLFLKQRRILRNLDAGNSNSTAA